MCVRVLALVASCQFGVKLADELEARNAVGDVGVAGANVEILAAEHAGACARVAIPQFRAPSVGDVLRLLPQLALELLQVAGDSRNLLPRVVPLRACGDVLVEPIGPLLRSFAAFHHEPSLFN